MIAGYHWFNDWGRDTMIALPGVAVVPQGPLGYLTLWPDGDPMPVVSTLNAPDGLVTSNMAIIGNNDSEIDAYAHGTTNLILDIAGYFAP